MSVQEHGKVWKRESSRARNAPSISEASQTWRNVQHSLCQHLHSKNASRTPWLKASHHCNKEYFCSFNTFQEKKKKILHYLLAMDIYAEAHHTTAIFYQVIIDLHQTLCTVAPKIPSFLPKLSVEGKEKLGLVWLLLG